MSNPFSHLTLLIPDKPDYERDSMALAWERRGGSVLRLSRFWEPPPLDPQQVRVYGGEAFCLVLQQKLGLTLLSPSDDLLLRVPLGLLRRQVRIISIAEANQITFPTFVKSVTPKLFRAGVYSTLDSLTYEVGELPDQGLIMVSEVVDFKAEARAFILDNTVLDCALYEGNASTADARVVAAKVASSMELPRSVVVDVGLTDQGWAVIEFNASWGAGLNGCRADAVLPAVAAASEPTVS